MVNELFGPVVTIYVYPADKYEETVRAIYLYKTHCVVSHVIWIQLELADKTGNYALTGSM